jgi:hypothetical protein
MAIFFCFSPRLTASRYPAIVTQNIIMSTPINHLGQLLSQTIFNTLNVDCLEKQEVPSSTGISFKTLDWPKEFRTRRLAERKAVVS